MMWIIGVDTALPVFKIKPVVVMGYRDELSVEGYIGKEGIIRSLQVLGLTPITRGSYITSDISLFGFKGKDINVSVDGERFANTCPNRMDVPIIRFNPLEIGKIIIYPNSTIGSALGGEIRAIRRSPSENISLFGYSKLDAISSTGGEIAVGSEGYNQGLYLRSSRATTYKDGKGRDFVQLYGYKPDVKYSHTFYEGNINGKVGKFSYNFGVWYYKDVLFPYLRMDERISKTFSFGLSFMGNRFYTNYTDHIMDNGLRNEPMYMRTDARRFRFGFVGSFYDMYYDHWDALNIMTHMDHKMEQEIIPHFSSFNAIFGKDFQTDFVGLFAKLGVQYFKTEVNKGRIFVPFSLRFSYSIVSFEISSDPPDPKELYFSLRRMPPKPSFLGNPNLNQPIKFSLYTNPASKYVNLLLFSNIVKDYVEVVGKVVNGNKITTFENTDALILGFNLIVGTEYLKLSTNYTYGRSIKVDDYLSEIPPFSLSLTLQSPEYLKSKVFVRFNYNDAQTRVAKSINEKPTTSWKTVDVGYELKINNIIVSVVLENIFNETYYTHLSYLRDPFMSGIRVYEPGRTLKISIGF